MQFLPMRRRAVLRAAAAAAVSPAACKARQRPGKAGSAVALDGFSQRRAMSAMGT